MTERSRIKRRWVAGFFAVLCLSLALLFHLSFWNPPRSDYWSVLYVFHQVAASDEPLAWFAIVNYDPWQDGTLRPLAYFLLYAEHVIFGADFFWNHFTNFVGYCCSLFLLYLLARRFGCPRMLTVVFVTVYAFLYTHFDIVSWTFHIFIIVGFCACLSAIILYLNFLKTGRTLILIPVGCLLLLGLFCYEGYALWPLGLLILGDGQILFSDRRTSPWPRYRCVIPFLIVIYFLYLVGFMLTRSAVINTGSLPQPSIVQVLTGICAPFFNLVYNGLLVNICPFLSLPLDIADNLEMRGLLGIWGFPLLNRLVLLIGGYVLVIFLVTLVYLRVGKRRGLLVISAFLIFLYAATFIPIALGRIATNDLFFPLVQFRYQYVPNALLILLLLVIVTRLGRPGRRGMVVTCLILLPILVSNIILVKSALETTEDQLYPLRELLSYIRLGIERGIINSKEKVYIDDKVVLKYPRLCWNQAMAQFLEGTYQWIFPSRDMECFAFLPEEAVWITDVEQGQYRNGYWQIWVGRRSP